MKTILISFLFFSLIGLTAGEDLQKLPLPELEQQAEHGDAGAQYCLGLLYLKGMGVSKDELEASRWFEKAAAAGYQEAKEALKTIDRN